MFWSLPQAIVNSPLEMTATSESKKSTTKQASITNVKKGQSKSLDVNIDSCERLKLLRMYPAANPRAAVKQNKRQLDDSVFFTNSLAHFGCGSVPAPQASSLALEISFANPFVFNLLFGEWWHICPRRGDRGEYRALQWRKPVEH